VPEAVLAEFMVRASNTEDERRFKKIIETAKVKDYFAVMALQADLGKGESGKRGMREKNFWMDDKLYKRILKEIK
jgi:predicted nucleic acid-binding protein